MRLGCIIWAEFLRMRIGRSTNEFFFVISNGLFLSRKKQVLTRPNIALLSPLDNGTPRIGRQVTLGIWGYFGLPLGFEFQVFHFLS